MDGASTGVYNFQVTQPRCVWMHFTDTCYAPYTQSFLRLERKMKEPCCLHFVLWQYFAKAYKHVWGQGESAGPYWGHRVTERWHRWPKEGSSYSPRVVDADYSLSPPKTVRAWWTATTYEWWPCCAEHSGSEGVNLEKQSPTLRCECRAYGMNGSGWVCQ